MLRFVPLTGEDPEEIARMSRLASRIVKEVFDPIVGPEQNDYMIGMFQTVEAITEQIRHGYQYYFVVNEMGETIGFLAFYRRDGELYLSKFYLVRECRRKGLSREMLRFVAEKAKELGLPVVTLNVNRSNPAIFAYEKLGFQKIREEKNDIGGGFVMDDFVYAYTV